MILWILPFDHPAHASRSLCDVLENLGIPPTFAGIHQAHLILLTLQQVLPQLSHPLWLCSLESHPLVSHALVSHPFESQDIYGYLIQEWETATQWFHLYHWVCLPHLWGQLLFEWRWWCTWCGQDEEAGLKLVLTFICISTSLPVHQHLWSWYLTHNPAWWVHGNFHWS